MISLTKFCKDNGLAKSTVFNRCKELGIVTSNGLDVAAVNQLRTEFSLPTQPQQSAPNTLTVLTGNHRGQLALPTVPSEINLENVRGEVPLSSFQTEDIDRFLDACDGFLEAVDTDYQNQLAVTQQKEQGVAKVKAKVEEVRTAKLRYQIRSETLSLHNRTLDTELQTNMAELSGKSPTAAPGVGGE
ncbi:hypothetical protein SPB21_02175 [Leptothoe sp. ISB3NOV94-8A]